MSVLSSVKEKDETGDRATIWFGQAGQVWHHGLEKGAAEVAGGPPLTAGSLSCERTSAKPGSVRIRTEVMTRYGIWNVKLESCATG